MKLLFFSAVGGLVGVLGLGLDLLLMRGGLSRLTILLISNTIIGAIAGSLLMQSNAREQEKRQIMQERITKIADMNHHVRNALAVVAFYGTQGGNANYAERVSQAVKRIEWTLREVLPRGWDLQSSIGMSIARKSAATGGGQFSFDLFKVVKTRRAAADVNQGGGSRSGHQTAAALRALALPAKKSK